MKRLSSYCIVILLLLILFIVNTLNDKAIEIEQLHNQNKVLTNQISQQQVKMNKLNDMIISLKSKRILTERDIKSLEKIVEAEASGEKIKGKILVSNVVLNRWLKAKDKSINQVIREKNQFSSVALGKYSKAIPSEQTKKAVVESIKNDYSSEAEYFINEKIADKRCILWFRNNLTLVSRSGNHDFYKK